MQFKIIIACVLVALFATATSKWVWSDEQAADTLAAPLRPREETAQTLAVPTLQTPSKPSSDSLHANHGEAKAASDLLLKLIERLRSNINTDTQETSTKIQQRADKIETFKAAVEDAKKVKADLEARYAALGQEIKTASESLTANTAAQTTEQKAIETENAAQRKRLGERIAAVENQIALINRILALIAGPIVNPESVILSLDQDQKLQGLFAGTSVAGKSLRRCYRASESGYASTAFVSQCARKGPLAIVVKSTNGNIFGGFSSAAFDNAGAYKADLTAFLFSIYRNGATNAVKIPVKRDGNNQHAIYSGGNYGPTFGGGHDLYVADRCNSNGGYTNLGHTYDVSGQGLTYGQDNAKTFLAGTYQFTCADYEAYFFV